VFLTTDNTDFADKVPDRASHEAGASNPTWRCPAKPSADSKFSNAELWLTVFTYLHVCHITVALREKLQAMHHGSFVLVSWTTEIPCADWRAAAFIHKGHREFLQKRNVHMLMLSVLFGAIVGLSLGLTGGGGAIFAVPMLVYGLGISARESVTISLVSVGMTSLIGFLLKWRKGEAEIAAGLIFACAGMVGAPIGTWISGQFPEILLMLFFSVLMLIISVNMWVRGTQYRLQAETCGPVVRHDVQSSDHFRDGASCQRDVSGNLILSSRCAWLLLLTGVIAGILSGMFGVGGGFIIVPALIAFSGMSMLRAVGTSLMVIAMISASGVTAQLVAGQPINLAVTSCFVTGGLGGLWIGQAISQRISPSLLQRIFALAILLVAVFVVFRNLYQR
jgi:uncharacterized membrane protein YfcA